MLGMVGSLVRVILKNLWDQPHDAGVHIFDVKTDPAKPRHLSHWDLSPGLGTHRSFYNGGRYVHLSASHPKYKGYIYRILDISHPRKPTEVSYFTMPSQENWSGKLSDIQSSLDLGLHGPPYPKGKFAYLPYASGERMVVVDISDIKAPKFVSQIKTCPPLGGGNHIPRFNFGQVSTFADLLKQASLDGGSGSGIHNGFHEITFVGEDVAVYVRFVTEFLEHPAGPPQKRRSDGPDAGVDGEVAQRAFGDRGRAGRP